MALMFLARFLHHGLILFLVSTFCLINCQPNSPQNIETHYPYSPPPIPSPSPPVLPPPTPPITPSPPPPPVAPTPSSKPENGNNTRAIATAVVATAAGALAVSGLLFFLLRRRSLKRKRGDSGSSNGGLPMLSRDQFSRFDGNIKGLIVDENGLDVLYWRKLRGKSENNRIGKNQSHDSKNEKEEGEEVEGTNPRGKRVQPVQEVPLLRDKSSTSHVNSAAINQSPNVTLAPEGISLKAVDKPKPSKQSLTPGPAPTESPESVTLSAIPANSSPLPTPPPPPTQTTPPIKAAPAPPPPPPPKVSTMAGPSKAPPPLPQPMQGESSSEKGQSKTGQGKLKPLHWDKVNPNMNHSMVWNKIEDGSFKFDDDLMEAMFGYVATNHKSPKGTNSSPNPGNLNPGPAGQIFILDTRKSQNIAIVLKSLSISRKEIIDALTEGQGLDTDTLERLNRIAPTKEEKSLLLQFGGDPTRLADAESFLYHLLKAVPSAFTRFNAMHFRLNYETEISYLKETLQTVDLACKELRTRGLFMKLLEAILKAGNKMNAGTARGNAQAFDLTALRKLSDVKSTDGKTTLLNFVVEEVVRAEGKRCVVNRNNTISRASSQSSGVSANSENSPDQEKEYMMLGLPVVGSLSAEFSNVKKAASIDYESFAGSCAALLSRVSEIRQLVYQCTNDGGSFVRVMQGFLHSAESQLNALRKQQAILMELVKTTTEYYQGGASKDKGANPLQLFFIIKDFLSMVDHVCIEIARHLQRKKSSTGRNGSSPPRSYGPRAVRFPNLPPHFLFDKS